MSLPKRYWLAIEDVDALYESEDGEWVKFSDVQALLSPISEEQWNEFTTQKKLSREAVNQLLEER